MKTGKNYREAGYKQGFSDGSITGGKINKRYVKYLLETETRNLSHEDSSQYKDGWQEGFVDAIRDSITDLVKKEDYVLDHIDKIYGIG